MKEGIHKKSYVKYIENTNEPIVSENRGYMRIRLGREAQEGRITKRHKETFGVMDMFTFFVFSVVMVSQMYTCVKTCKMYTSNISNFYCVNYSLVKL